MSEEKQEKQVGEMNIPELLDELIKCAKSQKVDEVLPLMFRVDKDKYEARMTYLARRIEACRDEIVRRVC